LDADPFLWESTEKIVFLPPIKQNTMTRLLLPLIILFLSFENLTAQSKVAYWGTIFVDSSIIRSSDPSAFQKLTATGRGERRVFDRRTSGWITINAYLFRIEWSDGLVTEAQVNPEFGDSLAPLEAAKYALEVGRIPTCLRKDIRSLWIHPGKKPFGGGNHAILIHTGQSAEYERTGILEETLIHEASHTSLDDAFARDAGWLAAQKADVNFISNYAKDNPIREDVAETFLLWMAVRQFPRRISQKTYDTVTTYIPNRLRFWDRQNLPMAPFVLQIAR
jgi:hypothetical protein